MNPEAISHLFHEDLYQLPSHPLVVILSKEWSLYSAEEKTLLAKILGAVKLDLSSAQIITSRESSVAGLASLATPRILVFGTSLDEIKPYEHIQAQGFSVIKADDLPALDEAKKKSLWLALRNMFGV